MVENYVYDTGFQFRIGSRNKIHGFTNFSEVKIFSFLYHYISVSEKTGKLQTIKIQNKNL